MTLLADALSLEGIRRFIEAGGPVVAALVLVGLLLWALIFERAFFHLRARRQLLAAVQQQWDARSDQASWYAQRTRERLISEARLRIRGSLPVIKALVAACPMIGLLGTVTGMIQVFEVMAAQGTGDARAMAGGVSAATLPTLSGMVLALSGIYPVSRFEYLLERSTRALRDHMQPSPA